MKLLLVARPIVRRSLALFRAEHRQIGRVINRLAKCSRHVANLVVWLLRGDKIVLASSAIQLTVEMSVVSGSVICRQTIATVSL